MMSEDVRALRLNGEAALAMAERTIRRLFILLLVLIVMWGLTTGAFIWYINQFDYTAYDYQQDGEGLNFVGGDWNGVSFNGAESTDSNTETQGR